MKLDKKVLVLLTVLILVGSMAVWAAQAKPAPKPPAARELGGTVVSFSASSLVVSHEVKGNKTEVVFVLNPETQQEGKLAVGEKVTVHYRMENNENVATRVRAHMAATAPSTTPKPKK